MAKRMNYDEQRTWRTRLARYTSDELARLIERNGSGDSIAQLADDELENRVGNGSIKPLIRRAPTPCGLVTTAPVMRAVDGYVFMAVTSGADTMHYTLPSRTFAALVNAGVRIVTAPKPAASTVTPLIGAQRRRQQRENGRRR